MEQHFEGEWGGPILYRRKNWLAPNRLAGNSRFAPPKGTESAIIGTESAIIRVGNSSKNSIRAVPTRLGSALFQRKR
jgi:hypothetical protein